MRPQCLLLLLALVLPLAAGGLVGGWKPIKNVKDPKVQKIAEFAVTTYNNQANANLKLKSVVKGETQVVYGLKYRLVLAVNNGTTPQRYEAVVSEKRQSKKLISFNHL
ncbi:hypothetical protein UlMin_017593 [Ulmus minor]